MFRIIFFVLIFFNNNVFADCSFNSANFSKKLEDPSEINKIEIVIHNSKKFAINSMKIISDTSVRHIKEKYKDIFKASINVKYNFGNCVYNAYLRQSGDYKDHISLHDNGKTISSLDIKLENGNILNATRFKLLLPKTRGGSNEVIGSYLLRTLGIISPETFFVKASINSSESIFIFQESAEKEMLERNLRREGPLFEGDESLLWNDKNFKLFELESISLARITNDYWAEKSPVTTIISLESFLKLQNAYIEYTDRKSKKSLITELYIQPNKIQNKEIFLKYHILLFAMNGVHGLRPHNRKYYYNIFIQDFEPVYYDGDLYLYDNFQYHLEPELPIFLNETDNFIFNNLKKEIIKLTKNEIFINSLLVRLNNSDEYFVNKNKKNKQQIIKGLNQIYLNINNLIDIKNNNFEVDNIIITKKNKFKNNFKQFLLRLKKFDLKTHIYQVKSIKKNKILTTCLYPEQCSDNKLNYDSLIQIMNENKINDNRVTLISNNNFIENLKNDKIKKIFFDKGEIIYSINGKVKIIKEEKKIILQQKNSNDWFLFRKIMLDSWSIEFVGSTSFESSDNKEKFNEFGLTGCLNFYETVFSEVIISGLRGGCEDSINIIHSKGNIKKIDIRNAFADAIDIDFSNLIIQKIYVNDAGNDCIDISKGKYFFKKIESNNCKDKGVSVGEKSNFFSEDIKIKNTKIGLSSKDFSIAEVNNLFVDNSTICLEAFNKKQEFGGGTIIIDKLFCEGKIIKDSNSNITIKSQ